MRQLRVGDRRVRYVDAGDGPAVLLLHGIVHSAWGWRHTIPLLVESGFRVIALDSPGHGYSDMVPLDGFRDGAAFVGNLVAETLDTMCVDRCAVVGHSMGGLFATLLALSHPERVERLCLCAPGGLGPFTPLHLRLLTLRLLGSLPPAAMSRTGNRRFFRRFLVHDPELAERMADEELAEARIWMRRTGVVQYVHQLLRAGLRLRGIRPGFNYLERLGEISCPTLIFWGVDDRIIPFRNAEIVAGRIAGSRLSVMEHSGHMVIYEELERFQSELLDFLRVAAA
ncbi:MAG: alpha/beta fold hydrolase [Candidatus Dormibacteria bacterium]